MLNKILIVLGTSVLLVITSCGNSNKIAEDEKCIQLPGAPLPPACSKA